MTGPARLRDLDPSGDRVAIERLWAAAVGDVWPVLPAGLDVLRTGVVAEAGGEPVGVVAVEAGDDRQGGVQLLLVDPPCSDRGSGPGCSGRGSSGYRPTGSQPPPSAAGGHDYLWPGVPEDLPGAAEFFAARGWVVGYRVLDLIADLRGYQAPPGTLERAERAEVTIEVQAKPDPGGRGVRL